MRKFLIGWTATTRLGSVATGSIFVESEELTEETVRTWEAGITEANDFRQTSVMHVTEMDR